MTHWRHLQHLLPRKRSSSKKSTQTPSDQLPRELKSAAYRNPDYVVGLEKYGSFMRKSHLDVSDTSKDLCRRLLRSEQAVPRDSLFRDDLFDKTCQNIQARNEAMVFGTSVC